ncbi:MAG: S26 family signal peptidase [Candidatus Zixiibacteriota bacterium]
MSKISPRSIYFNTLLHLLLPGLGHILWHEYLFGIFVFLATLLGMVLFVVSLLVDMPIGAKLVMCTLPVLFYAFTFVDLLRTVQIKRAKMSVRKSAATVFLLAGLGYQVLSPIAPLNFTIRNFPEFFILKNNSMSPLYLKGDVLKASRLSYMVDVFVVKKPILHSLPQRYEVVRFVTGSGQHNIGIVVGLPGEEIEIVEGVVIIDGIPDVGDAPGGIILTGDWPLTATDRFSVQIATINLGRIEEVHEVPLTSLIGKVSKLF